MAKKAKIRTNFEDESDGDFSDITTKIINSITLNIGNFGFITITMAILLAQLKAFNLVRNAVAYPSQAADTLDERIIVQGSLTENGDLINDNADGNVSLLKKSGYPMAKPDAKQKVLSQTLLVMTASDTAGDLGYEISGGDGAQNPKFAIFYTKVSNSEPNPYNWTFFYSPKRKGTITGLESKEDYKFISVAMGTNPKLLTSAPVIKAAQ